MYFFVAFVLLKAVFFPSRQLKKKFREFVCIRLLPIAGVANVMQVPSFDGAAPSFANYEVEVTPRNHISTSGPKKRAANLLLHMSDAARKVCMSVGRKLLEVRTE